MAQKNLTFRILTIAFLGLLTVSVAACAKPQAGGTGASDTASSSGVNDPIEPVNRAVFGFNSFLDMAIIEPAAKVYNAVLPVFVRDGVQNFMRNLRSPIIIANNILQGNVSGAGTATARFLINSTVGIGGVVDVASKQGLTYASEDFGQTLGVWGLGEGMYIVLPVFGPSNLRDTAGMAVDSYADPLRIWSFKTGRDWIYYTRNAVEGFDNRARLVRAVEDLRRNSLDYYAAVRSAYAQKRKSLVSNEGTDGASASIPDYDEKN